MNFIVILAISLVVMLVIIGIFGARSREGNQNLRACEARNGVCVVGATTCDPVAHPDKKITETPIFGAICYQPDSSDEIADDYVCCMRKVDD